MKLIDYVLCGCRENLGMDKLDNMEFRTYIMELIGKLNISKESKAEFTKECSRALLAEESNNLELFDSFLKIGILLGIEIANFENSLV